MARERLAALGANVAQAVRGKPVPAANLHLTLVFLGEIDDERAARLPEIAARVVACAFELELDQVGSFARARVAWAGCASAPAQLVALQSTLSKGLAACGFELEERPFAPHLTLARKAAVPLPSARIETIHWRAEEFVLVRSGAVRYETVARWRLG